MVAAQLARMTKLCAKPLHIALIDRQTSIAEGAAYRSADAVHLLNVPARGMSAWPDRPEDFLHWSHRRDPLVGPYSFLQRRHYAEYLRAQLFESIAGATDHLSIEIHRQEAHAIERRPQGGWQVQCGESEFFDADAVVLATGHRPPDDPLANSWVGSRARYVVDPWACLALASIEPHESVCLLGTGLTAVDVLQSLASADRRAPVLALSRRGLLPAAHAPAPLPPIDPRVWLEPLLRDDAVLTVSELSNAIRQAVDRAISANQDWRAIIDGLRPSIARLWQKLPPAERKRFLRHARPFWEVARHRMAPIVAASVEEMRRTGLFATIAARALASCGDKDGVTLVIARRGGGEQETRQFDWVVNCTGPGTYGRSGLPPLLANLVSSGYLEEDPLRLGVCCTSDGRALVQGQVIDDLLVVGTLRKPALWESTAVPELRQQCAVAAEIIMGERAKAAQTPLLQAIGH